MNGDGWIGRYGQVLHFLHVVGADTDEHGRPRVDGTVSLFLGIEDENNDIVVGADAGYFVGGRRCPLAAGLRGTSYGLGVKIY